MALVSIALLVGSIYSIINPTSNQNYLSNLYHTDHYAEYLKNPSKINEVQFIWYKFKFSNHALPESSISKIDVFTIDDIPILFEFISYGSDNEVRSYFYALDVEKKQLYNYASDDALSLQDSSSLCYYIQESSSAILDRLSDLENNIQKCNIKDFKVSKPVEGIVLRIEVQSQEDSELPQYAYEESLELSKRISKEHKDSCIKIENKREIEIAAKTARLAEGPQEAITSDGDFKEIPDGAHGLVKSLIYTGDGLSKPLMTIKSAYDLSVMNFKSWYDLQLNPKNHNSITIDKANPGFYNYVSKPYYPLVAEDSVKPGIDFTTQYVHPSARKYLYNVNNPSYYYLYKESLTGSEFSGLAKKLLYPHTVHEILTVNTDNTISDREVIESEVPHDFKHFYKPFPSEAFIGISMNTGGIFYPFHLGLLSLLSEYNIVNINTPLLGTSAGSIAVGKLSTGMDFYESMAWAERVIGDYKKNGAIGRINPVLSEALHEMFPSDAHQFLSNRIGKIYICYTLFKPLNKISHISHYFNKEDLVDSILASVHIPKYSDNDWTVKHRNKRTIDGGTLPNFNLHDYPDCGSLRTVFAYAYFDRKIHEKCGFNNVISQYNVTKTGHINYYLLLKSIQSRFLLIKYKLKDNLTEWMNFMSAVILYCNHLVSSDAEIESIVLKTSKKIIKGHMNKDEIALIKKLVCHETERNISTKCFRSREKISVDQFTPQIGLIEWIRMEQERIYLSRELEINKEMLTKIKSIIKYPSQLNIHLDVLALKGLICIISDFLTHIVPPMNLTYYYTKTPSMLHVRYSFRKGWDIFLNGNSTEGTRLLFDQGRAAAYRWVILEYISMENYLYNKYKYYLKKLDEIEEIINPNITIDESQLESSQNEVKCSLLSDFQRKQMYYITDLLNHFSNTKRVGEGEPDGDNAVEGELDWLFDKRNGIVKKAIEIELLDNTGFIHILTHTHHWLNSHITY